MVLMTMSNHQSLYLADIILQISEIRDNKVNTKHIICREEDEFRTLCQTSMLLPDAMIDAINELAVTYTDDTIIDPDGNFWILSDFYANDVMNAVVAREEDL